MQIKRYHQVACFTSGQVWFGGLRARLMCTRYIIVRVSHANKKNFYVVKFYIYIYIYIYVYIYMYICMYVFVCVSVCFCVFVYVCIQRVNSEDRDREDSFKRE